MPNISNIDIVILRSCICFPRPMKMSTPRFHTFLFATFTALAGSAHADLDAWAKAQDNTSGFHITDAPNTVSGLTTATQTGDHGSATTTASYGSLTASVHVQADNFLTFGNYLGGGYDAGSVDFGDGDISKNYWIDSVTVDPTAAHPAGSIGTARVTFAFSGTYSDSGNVSGISGWQFVVQNSAFRHSLGTDSTQVGDIPTVTVTIGFTYGQPFNIQAGLQATGSTNGNFAGESINASLSLRQTKFEVITGGTNNAFTSSSKTGSAGAETVSLNGSYGGFTLQNTSPYGHGSKASILGGTASANRTLNVAFAGQFANFTAASDVVDISGNGGDKYVLQLSYDPSTAVSLFGSEANAVLLWQDPTSGVFKNAIMGNSDAGAQHQAFTGAYNPATEFALGNYGVDTVNHVVWAVVDHGNDFAVGAPQTVPEPGTWVTLLSGVGMLAAWRRRRRT